MAQQVYTTTFVTVLLTSTRTVLYTVPAGKIAVLTNMTMAYATTARAGGLFEVLLGQSNSFIWLGDIAASQRSTLFWVGRLAMPAGQQIRGSSAAIGAPFMTASGYLFSA